MPKYSKKTQYSRAKNTEEALTRKLEVTLLAIVGIISSIIILLAFFAPKVGYFFGLFSIHRNEPDSQITVKPNSPTFINFPKATNNKQIAINGFSQSGATVRLYVNGPEVATTTAGADGVFTFTSIQLITGNNTLYARATDAYGNESNKSETYTLSLDTEKPKIDIESPKDGSTVRNLDKRITIKGKMDKKASIKINDKVAILKSDLSFEFLLGVNEGEVKIKVEATDEAGNISEENLTVKYYKVGF